MSVESKAAARQSLIENIFKEELQKYITGVI
jgi:hypothetical protein